MNRKCNDRGCVFRLAVDNDPTMCGNDKCLNRVNDESNILCVRNTTVLFCGTDISRNVQSYRMENGRIYLNLMFTADEVYGVSNDGKQANA